MPFFYICHIESNQRFHREKSKGHENRSKISIQGKAHKYGNLVLLEIRSKDIRQSAVQTRSANLR